MELTTEDRRIEVYKETIKVHNLASGDLIVERPLYGFEGHLANEVERLRGLLADDEYIRMRADYARGHKSWANMINEREARR